MFHRNSGRMTAVPSSSSSSSSSITVLATRQQQKQRRRRRPGTDRRCGSPTLQRLLFAVVVVGAVAVLLHRSNSGSHPRGGSGSGSGYGLFAAAWTPPPPSRALGSPWWRRGTVGRTSTGTGGSRHARRSFPLSFCDQTGAAHWTETTAVGAIPTERIGGSSSKGNHHHHHHLHRSNSTVVLASTATTTYNPYHPCYYRSYDGHAAADREDSTDGGGGDDDDGDGYRAGGGATTATTTSTAVQLEGGDSATTVAAAAAAAADMAAKAQARAANQARGLLLLASALYGTNFAVLKWLLLHTDSSGSSGVGLQTTARFLLAAACTAPWLVFRGSGSGGGAAHVDRGESPREAVEAERAGIQLSRLGTSDTDDDNDDTAEPNDEKWAAITVGLEVGAWNAVGYVAQAVGLEHTLASESAFVCSLAVIVVPLLDWLLSGRVLRPRQLIGALLALIGVAALELGPDAAAAAAATPWQWTDGISYLQPLAFGMGFWRMERAMQQFPTQAARCTAAQLQAVFAGAALYTAAVALVTNHGGGGTAAAVAAAALPSAAWREVTVQVQQWLSDPLIAAALVWTGCVTSALTVYMETVALKTLSAAETTLIMCTEPVWGSLAAAVLLKETFGVSAAVAGALILAGCVTSTVQWRGEDGDGVEP